MTDDFVLDADELPPLPPVRRIPWGMIAAIVGGVVLVAALVVGTILLIDKFASPPDKAVEGYYTALSAGDTAQASLYLDPNCSNFQLKVLDVIRSAAGILGKVLPDTEGALQLSFVNLTYNVLGKEKNTAQVQVRGDVRVLVPGLLIDLSLPYSATHDLLKIEGDWKLTCD